MATIYKPVQKVQFTCACGCGKTRFGNHKAMYYNSACRLRAWLNRKKQNAA